jgi:hypothetical protein
VGKGRTYGSALHPAWDAVVGGWTIQYLGNYSSGEPLGFGGTDTPYFAPWPYNNNRAVMLNPTGMSLKASQFDASRFDMSQVSTPGAAANTYVNTSLVEDPPTWTRGNASFRTSQIRGFAFLNDDFSVQKNFSVKERVRVQFRAEFLNLFNRHRFSGIDTNPASTTFGQITSVSDDRRQIQFGIRADF